MANDFQLSLAGSPTFRDDAEILAEQERARKSRSERGSSILPAASFSPSVRDRILAALQGLGGGLAAARGAQTPIGAALAGIAGAAGARSPEQFAQAREEARLKLMAEQLDMTPIEQISPDMIEKYPELRGLPVSIIGKIAPTLQRTEQFQQKLILMEAELKEMRERRIGGERTARTGQLLARKKAIEQQLAGAEGLVLKSTNKKLFDALELELAQVDAAMGGAPAKAPARPPAKQPAAQAKPAQKDPLGIR